MHIENYIGKPVDPDEYKLETTGARSEEVAKLVKDLVLSVMNEPIHVQNRADVAKLLLTEPDSISKLFERRMRKTSNFLYSSGEYQTEYVFTDLLLMIALQEQGYAFDNFKVDVNFLLGNEPNVVDFDGLLTYYAEGLKNAYSKGKDIRIPNPFNLEQKVSAEHLVEAIRNRNVELKNTSINNENTKKTV